MPASKGLLQYLAPSPPAPLPQAGEGGLGTASNAKVLDAVLASHSATSDAPVKASWFWDFSQLDSASRREKKERSDVKAIDAILAGY